MPMLHTDGVDDLVVFAIGSLNFAFGPGTIVWIGRKGDDSGTETLLKVGTSSTSAQYGIEFANTVPRLKCGTSLVNPPTITITAADDLVLFAATKATGSVPPRYHKYDFSTETWTHENSASNLANSGVPATSARIGATNSPSQFFNGDHGFLGVSNTVLSDATIETLVESPEAWDAAGLVTNWPLDQENIPSAFPTTGLLDNFNRANGGLGANWSDDPLNASPSAFSIDTNVVKSPTYSEAWWNPSTYGPNVECFATVQARGGNTYGVYVGVLQDPNTASSTADGYQVGLIFGATDKFEVYRYDNAAFTLIASANLPAQVVAGDKIGIEVTSTGVVKSHLFRAGAWSQITSTADGTYTFSTGNAVLEMAIFDGSNTARLDDFSGGTDVGTDPIQDIIGTADETSRVGTTITALDIPWTGSGGGEIEEGSGALDASSSLSGSAKRTLGGKGEISASSSLAGSAKITASAGGSLSGASSLSGGASRTLTSGGSVSATSGLSGTAARTLTGSGEVAGASDLDGAGGLTRTGTGSLSSTSSLSGTASVLAVVTGEGSMSSTSTLAGSASLTLGGYGALSGISTLEGTVNMVWAGGGSLFAESSLEGAATTGVVFGELKMGRISDVREGRISNVRTGRIT